MGTLHMSDKFVQKADVADTQTNQVRRIIIEPRPRTRNPFKNARQVSGVRDRLPSHGPPPGQPSTAMVAEQYRTKYRT